MTMPLKFTSVFIIIQKLVKNRIFIRYFIIYTLHYTQVNVSQTYRALKITLRPLKIYVYARRLIQIYVNT